MLLQVRMVMEDSLQYLVHGSVAEYAAFHSALCNCSAQVHSCNSVTVISGPSAKKSMPLLTLDMDFVPDTGRIQYSEDLQPIPERMAALIEAGIAATEGLTQLEPFVMSKLFWAYKPKLSSVHPREVRLDVQITRSSAKGTTGCMGHVHVQGLPISDTTLI